MIWLDYPLLDNLVCLYITRMPNLFLYLWETTKLFLKLMCLKLLSWASESRGSYSSATFAMSSPFDFQFPIEKKFSFIPWSTFGCDQWLSASTKFLCVVFLILKFSSASLLSFFAHVKGLGHISSKKYFVVPQRLMNKIWHSDDFRHTELLING